MNSDATSFVTKEGKKISESSLFGVSMRGWMATTLIYTLCLREILKVVVAGYIAVTKQDLTNFGSQIAIDEPFYSIAVAISAYYFAKMTMPKQEPKA